MSIITDIETEPLPLDELKCKLGPYQCKAVHPGEFNPATVKYGNAKAEDKRAEILAKAQEKHATALAEYQAELANGEEAYWQAVQQKAALSAVTGRVLAIGYHSPDKDKILLNHAKPEEELLCKFWETVNSMKKQGRMIIGHNILQFDLPFLVRRSWMLHVDVPGWVRNGRYWSPIFLDTRDAWLLGQPWSNCESSLGHIAQALGVGAKTEGIDGGDFARLYHGTPEEFQQALDYLTNDLHLTTLVAKRLGVL